MSITITTKLSNPKELFIYLEFIKSSIEQAKSELEILEGGEFAGIPYHDEDASDKDIKRIYYLHECVHSLYKLNDAVGREISNYYEILD
jgi:hypothetical protein